MAGLKNPNLPITKAYPNVTTKYYLNITDKNGCSSSDSITINVLKNPKTEINGDINVCDGKEYIYQAVPTNNNLNTWKISGAKTVDSTDKNTIKIVWDAVSSGKNQTMADISWRM